MRTVARVLPWVVLVTLACKAGKIKDAAPPAVDDAASSELRVVEQVVIDDVKVELLSGPDQELGRELALLLGRQLTESGMFFANAEQADSTLPLRPASVVVALGYDRLREGSDGGPSILVAAEASVVWAGADDAFMLEKVLGERPYTKDESKKLDPVIAAHMGRTLAEAGRGLIAKERIRRSSDSELVAALSSTDPGLVVWALSLLGERKPANAVQAVNRALGSSDKQVRDAAITAAVALGDPGAVDGLTKMAEFSDYEAIRTVIEAVGALGGRDAIDYLEFVATGHPDDSIKRQARRALERVDQR